MRLLLVGLAVLVSTSAFAKPLPSGTQVVLAKDNLWFVDHGTKVPLWDSLAPQAGRTFDKLTSAALSDDGKTIEVVVTGCIDMDDTPLEVSLAEVEARVENARGMQLHAKKRYAEAIPHFEAAVKGDPDTAVYATNLLCAQVMGKKLDDADRTLATAGARAVPWFAWRLAVDPELAGLRGRASTKPFTAAKPTKLAFDALGDDGIATSPLGYVAVHEWWAGGMGPTAQDLVIYDVKADRELLRLPIVTWDDACVDGDGDDAGMGPPCTKAQHAHVAAHVKAASDLLGQLGFEKVPAAWVDTPDTSAPVVSPDKQTTLLFDDVDKVVITHGKATKTVSTYVIPRRIAFAGRVIVLQYKVIWGCDGADTQRSESSVLQAP